MHAYIGGLSCQRDIDLWVLKTGSRCSYVAPPVHIAQPLNHQSSLTTLLYMQDRSDKLSCQALL